MRSRSTWIALLRSWILDLVRTLSAARSIKTLLAGVELGELFGQRYMKVGGHALLIGHGFFELALYCVGEVARYLEPGVVAADGVFGQVDGQVREVAVAPATAAA